MSANGKIARVRSAKRGRPRTRVESASPSQSTTMPLTIGAVASLSGVSARMIRYYEGQGLLRLVPRTDANYRVYLARDVHTLRFIQQARALGFSMVQLRVLLALWGDRRRPSGRVKQLALVHIQELDDRIVALQAMRDALSVLADHCAGDERPDCPILSGLAGGATPL